MAAALAPVLLLGLGEFHAWGRSATAGPVDVVVPMIAAGTEHELIALKYLHRVTTDTGTIEFSGKFTKLAGGVLPKQLLIIVRHLRENGTTIETRQFKLRVTPTGKIPRRSFGFRALTVEAGEQIAISIKPVGRPLESSNISFEWEYNQK